MTFWDKKKILNKSDLLFFSILSKKQARIEQRKYFEEALSILDQNDVSFACLKDLFEEILGHEV